MILLGHPISAEQLNWSRDAGKSHLLVDRSGIRECQVCKDKRSRPSGETTQS